MTDQSDLHSLGAMWQWKPERLAPRDAWPMAIAVRITCNCGKGGIVVLSGGRRNGEWIIDHFNHSFEIVEFFVLPKPSCTKGH